MNKLKTISVVREVIKQFNAKQTIEILANNTAEAINIVRIVPENDLQNIYKIKEEIISNTEIVVSSKINVEECKQIPTQLKLEMNG